MSKKPEPKAPKEPAKKYERLTPKQWAELEALYASGELNLGQLARKAGKAFKTVKDHMVKHGIKHGSAVEHKKAIAQAVTNASIEDATVLASRIRETKEEHYKMASGLAKLTWAEILKTKQDGNPLSMALGNLKSLDAAMTILKKAREERYAVLGLDGDFVDENEVPELVISELTADQVMALQQKSFSTEDLDDMTIAPVPDDDDDIVEEE